MSITIEQINHLARLARLELTPAEKKKYQKDISAILKYVKKVQEIHEKAPARCHPERSACLTGRQEGSLAATNRPDIVANCPAEERETIIKGFPEQESNMNKVKAVFE